MIRNVRNSLPRSILRHPLLRSTKPTSPSPPTPVPANPTQCLQPTIPPPPTSQSQPFSSPTRPDLSTHFRGYCSGGGGKVDYDREVDEINLKFAEAREDIDAALESKETVYFNEEAEMARESVKEVLGMFDGLLGRLPEKDKAALQRSMGLKMEQLKAELGQLND